MAYKSWMDESDKIEIPPIQDDNYSRNPPPLSPTFAWLESIDEHWDRMYDIRQQAIEGGWKYRGLLPRRKKYLAASRRAWDGLECPRWAKEAKRSVLRVGLCVDDYRRPITFDEAVKEVAVEGAQGLANRAAANAVRASAMENRDEFQPETLESVYWFRRECMDKLVYWEEAMGTLGKFRNHFDDGRAVYVSKVNQRIQSDNVGRHYFTVILIDHNMREYTLTVSDFRAWVEDNTLYITEWAYVGTTVSEMRPIKRQRLRMVEGLK